MTDINFPSKASDATGTGLPAPDVLPEGIDFELIELIFFAYRDFVGEADQTLAAYSFGRAHHRVLYFVSRNPGIRVSDLLEILRITKQSLGRVLKELIDSGYIEQSAGSVDRRERLLRSTAKGEALARALSEQQSARLSKALLGLGEEARKTVRIFLRHMIDRPVYKASPREDAR